MKIEFILRTPGNHTAQPVVEYGAVPRVGEMVTLDGGDTSHEVHEVTHDIKRGVVSVLLRL